MYVPVSGHSTGTPQLKIKVLEVMGRRARGYSIQRSLERDSRVAKPSSFFFSRGLRLLRVSVCLGGFVCHGVGLRRWLVSIVCACACVYYGLTTSVCEYIRATNQLCVCLCVLRGDNVCVRIHNSHKQTRGNRRERIRAKEKKKRETRRVQAKRGTDEHTLVLFLCISLRLAFFFLSKGPRFSLEASSSLSSYEKPTALPSSPCTCLCLRLSLSLPLSFPSCLKASCPL